MWQTYLEQNRGNHLGRIGRQRGAAQPGGQHGQHGPGWDVDWSDCHAQDQRREQRQQAEQKSARQGIIHWLRKPGRTSTVRADHDLT